MSFELPPIVKSAERILKEIEVVVRRFPRYHKYASGARLREQAWEVATLTTRAWRDGARRADWIEDLAVAIDGLNLSLQLAKQVEAFRSFAEFEALARLVADLGRQCGGWKKHQQGKGQNEPSQQASERRSQTLSSRDAQRGANL
jgi:hypothetical protein